MSEHDKDMPFSHTSDRPKAPRGRATNHCQSHDIKKTNEVSLTTINWASTRENLFVLGMFVVVVFVVVFFFLGGGGCEQPRHRPACAFAQSDQRLCFSHFGKNHIKTNFEFLASLCS